MGKNIAKAYFAAGCFWGVEVYFQNLDGVTKTEVGYMGGRTENPTYKEVCNHNTGHAETVEVEYDSTQISFEDLAKVFFEIHDPTQVNQQGPDVGSQYRSAIFCVDEEQKRIGKKLINILVEHGMKVATQLEKAASFYPAEEYHQDYYVKKGGKPYCHFRQKRF